MTKQLIIILLSFFFLPGALLAQEEEEDRKVEVLSLKNLKYTRINGKPVRILTGNVAFKKDKVVFRCDSAIQFEKDELIYAYRNVRFDDGDSVSLIGGDSLVYNDKNGKADISGETLILSDKKMTLRTSRLFFDLNKNMAYYLDSAYITDAENRLSSRIGYYYADSRTLYFKKNVRLDNPDYQVRTDTLQYNVRTETSVFKGPTEITSKEGDYVYCEDGVFNTILNTMRLGKNSFLQSENQQLSGDSLIYNAKTGMGLALKHVELLDTNRRLIVEGNYATYDRKLDAFMVTDSARMIQYENDSIFLSGDTLRFYYDSLREHQIAVLYHHVRIYSNDYQAVCDSMHYSSADSTVKYYGDPVFWLGEFQISATKITAKLDSAGLKQVFLHSSSVMGKRHDDQRFDQISGDSMTAVFQEGEVHRIFVHSTAQSIYFLFDEDSASIGAQKINAHRARIEFKEGDINILSYQKTTSSHTTPAKDVRPSDFIIGGFKWRGIQRPNSPEDVFYTPLISPPEALPEEIDAPTEE